MRRELRLAALLLLTAVPWMWWFGDYNLYLGYGDEQELKALPTPLERIVGSLFLGGAYSVVVTLLFWAFERTAGSSSDATSAHVEDQVANPAAKATSVRETGA